MVMRLMTSLFVLGFLCILLHFLKLFRYKFNVLNFCPLTKLCMVTKMADKRTPYQNQTSCSQPVLEIQGFMQICQWWACTLCGFLAWLWSSFEIEIGYNLHFFSFRTNLKTWLSECPLWKRSPLQSLEEKYNNLLANLSWTSGMTWHVVNEMATTISLVTCILLLFINCM